MILSARQLKWLLRFYPPLLFQRIWIVRVAEDFSSLVVKVNKSLFNINYNRSIFGGTILSAADICYPVLFHQLLSHKGYQVSVWSRSAEVHFKKQIVETVSFSVSLTEEDLMQTKFHLIETGKCVGVYPINIYNKKGEVCVNIKCEVYIRDLNFRNR